MTEHTTNTMITAQALPAILIGGSPNAGKSVLTYNLTQALRRRNIPHYVFRANPTMEGDWFLMANQDNVRSINISFDEYRGQWIPELREFVCQELGRRRHLPLLVDLGGQPKEENRNIFRACTHSLLLLKEEEKDLSQTWRTFTRENDLIPLAEITSKLEGTTPLTSSKPVIKGTLTGLVRGIQRIHGPVFEAIVDRVSDMFGAYSQEEREKRHLEDVQNEHIELVVHLDERLYALAPDTNEWSYDLLEPLLTELPTRTSMAVYGRGPNWLYGALAIHAGTQPFYQFDVRLGWVATPTLQVSATGQLPSGILYIEKPYTDDEQYTIRMHLPHNSIDYTDTSKLAFPEPPPHRGVIISGEELPLWLITALARFYQQFDVLWIALAENHNERAIVIHSRVDRYLIGDSLRMPV